MFNKIGNSVSGFIHSDEVKSAVSLATTVIIVVIICVAINVGVKEGTESVERLLHPASQAE